jgi:hypothetical protein
MKMIRIISVSTEILSQNLPNTGIEGYHFRSLVCIKCETTLTTIISEEFLFAISVQ